MNLLPVKVFWAVARFITLSGAGMQLFELYAVGDEVKAWLGTHREITTVMLAFYVACEVLYMALTAEADKTRRRGHEIEMEANDGDSDR